MVRRPMVFTKIICLPCRASEAAVHAQLQIMMAALSLHHASCFMLCSDFGSSILSPYQLYLKAGWFHTKVTMVLLL